MDMSKEFISEIMKLGVISHSEQDTVWQIAKKCVKQIGIPAGAGGLVIGAKAGSVSIPLGPIAAPIVMSGAMAGFLAGLAGGTISCTIMNTALRPQLRKLIEETKGKGIQ
jgi:hypothetical protein